MSVDTKHRFERYFARKIHYVADETEPIVFIYVGSVAIDEFRLAAFFSARNCLSSHWLLPFVYSFLLPDEKFGWVGSRRVPPPLLLNREKKKLPN